MGIPFGSGIQWLMDQHQRFVRSGLLVYLRVKNFQESTPETPVVTLEVGVPVPDTAGDGGYTDITIQPPPNVTDISMHNLGMAAQAGVRLNFGSKIFTISDSFVQSQMAMIEQEFGVTIEDPIDIFRTRGGTGNALGLVYQGRMHEILYPRSRQVSGQTISWQITGNAIEQLLTDEPPTIET